MTPTGSLAQLIREQNPSVQGKDWRIVIHDRAKLTRVKGKILIVGHHERGTRHSTA
jgi:hypothetical protein